MGGRGHVEPLFEVESIAARFGEGVGFGREGRGGHHGGRGRLLLLLVLDGLGFGAAAFVFGLTRFAVRSSHGKLCE